MGVLSWIVLRTDGFCTARGGGGKCWKLEPLRTEPPPSPFSHPFDEATGDRLSEAGPSAARPRPPLGSIPRQGAVTALCPGCVTVPSTQQVSLRRARPTGLIRERRIPPSGDAKALHSAGRWRPQFLRAVTPALNAGHLAGPKVSFLVPRLQNEPYPYISPGHSPDSGRSGGAEWGADSRLSAVNPASAWGLGRRRKEGLSHRVGSLGFRSPGPLPHLHVTPVRSPTAWGSHREGR